MENVKHILILLMMVVATDSCTKDEIITPAVEVTNTVVVKVNGETYTLKGTNVPAQPYDYTPHQKIYSANAEIMAPWLGLPDLEADFYVLRDKVANLTIVVVSYTDDLTENQVRGDIHQSLYECIVSYADVSYDMADQWYNEWVDSRILRDGWEGGGGSGGNPRYTIIFP